MKAEKKITRQSYDYAAERAYYREARICPNCGNGTASDVTQYTRSGLFRARKVYTCKKCGCKWKVKLYHEKKARSEA